MPRGRARAGAAKPHSKKKEAARILSPDEQWAAEIAERVLADCHTAGQSDFVVDDSRFVTGLVGRGGGKTTADKARLVIDMARIHKGRFVFGAPTLGMAAELLWEPMKETCEKLDIKAEWLESPREGGKICTFERTGSRLKLFGADNTKDIDKLRGQPFDGVVGDEFALWPPELQEKFLERVIIPRLGERNGWIRLTSTPGHDLRGPFYDRTRPGAVDKDTGEPLHRPYRDRHKPEFKGWKGWSSHWWTLQQVAELPNAATLWPAIVANWNAALETFERNKWSENHPVRMREYGGLWASDHTTTVFRFDPEKNLWNPGPGLEGLLLLKAAIAKLPEGHTWHFVLVGDMGHADPCAINVYAFSPTDPDRMLWHVFFFERTAMYAKPIAQLILGEGLDHQKPGGILGITGWPDGMVFDADKAHLEELANVYGLRFKKAERKADYKFGAIELTNGDLVDGRIKALKGSPLHTQLEQLQWKDTDAGVLKENPTQANHSTDTLIYGRKEVAHLFESGAVTDETKRPKDASSKAPKEPDEAEIAPTREGREYDSLLSDPDFGDNWGNY